MPRRMISIPISDLTAQELRVGSEVAVRVVGEVKEITAGGTYSTISCCGGEAEDESYPARLEIELIGPAGVKNVSAQMEALMDEED